MEVREEYMGPVVELLGKRRGQMFDMQGVGYVKIFAVNLSLLYLKANNIQPGILPLYLFKYPNNCTFFITPFFWV